MHPINKHAGGFSIKGGITPKTVPYVVLTVSDKVDGGKKSLNEAE